MELVDLEPVEHALGDRLDQVARLEPRLVAGVDADERRTLEDILNDRYILNRTTPSQLQRLLENPEVVRTRGQDTIETVRMSMTSV